MSEPEASTPPRSGFFVYVVPAVLYVAAIFYGGLIPNAPAPHFSHSDKVMHAIAFGFMLLVVWRAVRFELPALAAKKQLVLAFAIVVGLGGALELAQMATPTRSAELLDWIADILGAGASAGILSRLGRVAS